MASTARRNLDKALGEDNSKAIRAYVKSKLNNRTDELEELGDQLRALKEQVGDVNVPALNGRINAAARLLIGDIDDHNDLVQRFNNGQAPSPADVTRLNQPVASDDIIGQLRADLAALTEQVQVHEVRLAGHDEQLAAHETRFTGIQAAVEGAQATADNALALATQANERAQAGDNLLYRAANIGLMAGVFWFMLYLVFVGFGPGDWSLIGQIAWPVLIAGVVTCIAYIVLVQRGNQPAPVPAQQPATPQQAQDPAPAPAVA